MSKQNKCKICYNNLQNWEVKKKKAWEEGRLNCPGHFGNSSYEGEERRCSECGLDYSTKINEFGDTQYPKHEDIQYPPHLKKLSCLQLQKDKLKELQEKTSRSEEEQTEMIRLGNKLGVDIKYPSGSESDKKYLEIQINQLLKALKVSKQLPKNHPSFNEYDRQNLESRLAELKKEYKDKYGELPSSMRDDGNQERERERERAEMEAIMLFE